MKPPKLFIAALLLLVGARVLMLLFGTIAFIYHHIKWTSRAIKGRKLSILTNSLKEYYYWLAFADDQKGNVLCREIFNDWFTKPTLGRKEYGKFGETVSHVTGVNDHKGIQYAAGRLLTGILNVIDNQHTDKARVNPQYKRDKP